MRSSSRDPVHRPSRRRLDRRDHIEFPTTGGRTAFGNFYAPTNRDFAGPGGRAAAAHRDEPRRTDRRGLLRLRDRASSSSPAAATRCSTSTTAAAPATARPTASASRASGASSTSTTASPAPSPGRAGLVDGDRLAIRGGSASGFTTLAALAFRKTFDAGCTYFGIGDLRAFVKDTHKFESRYLESLVGPGPRRSSSTSTARRASTPSTSPRRCSSSRAPRTRSCRQSEAERIVDALFERRVPHAYLLYPGEDHGFRGQRRDHPLVRGELSFYAQVFGFEPADEIEPLEIQFLDEARERIEAARTA